LLCAVETGRIRQLMDLVLGATEKFKIIYNDLSKMILVHSCEIADADFYVEVTR
jgi:hypothetical protein